MDIKHHTHPDQLEIYTFWWSEARLVLAAIALLLGGVPAIFVLLPNAFIVITWPILELCWLLSGLASGYMIYRWYAGGQKIFGGKKTEDLLAFAVSVISGINLGIAGLIGANIGMRITHSHLIFLITGIVYLIAAGYLMKRWSESNKKIF